MDLYLDGVTDERLLSSISFKLLYDPDQLAYVKYKSLSGNGLMNTVNAGTPGVIQYAFISTSGSLVDGNTPLLTLWFTLAEDLGPGTQICFAFGEEIRADSVAAGNYSSQKRSVGAQLKPYGIGPIFGDANCDCEVTAADAAMILRALVGLDALSEAGRVNANVDGNASVTAADAAMILRYVVKCIDRFPAEN